jgi:uncharacterized protein (TIGR03435 family)
MRHLIRVVFASCAAFGQTPSFEVASIKPAPPATGKNMRVSMGGDPGRINYSNVTLRDVLARAYGVKEPQISGPDWLATERYDIIATLAPNTPKEQVPLMLQNLLAERFKVTVHRETKTMPAYALTVGKNGPKLKEADADAGFRVMFGPKGRQLSGKASIPKFVDALSNMMDRPVVDMTDLKGSYEIDLSWTPDESDRMAAKMAMMGGGHPGPPPGGRPEGGVEGKGPSENSDGPSIFAALQEKLGLKLEAKKLPVDLLIVDHADKVASEN